MRYIGNMIAGLLAFFILSACSGNLDDAALPMLSVEDTEIDLAGNETVHFSVTYNGLDVTASSRIYTQDGSIELETAEFVPDRTGDFIFVAEFEGLVSQPVSVTVIDTTPSVVESRYRRHIFLAEFTGAWCINCPDGLTRLMGILSLPSMKDVKDRIHLAAFHSNLEGEDVLAIPETQDLFNMFDNLAYPSFATDLRDAGTMDTNGITAFRPSVETSLNDYPAHCGVAVSSSMNQDRTSAEIKVKVTSEMTSEYRVVLLVLQDRLVAKQVTTLFPEGDREYIHSHVVRKVVTAYSGTFTGEKMTEDGQIRASEEAVRTWTVTMEPGWVPEDMHVYAMALDRNGYVNNMNLCPIDGGDSGYDLIY